MNWGRGLAAVASGLIMLLVIFIVATQLSVAATWPLLITICALTAIATVVLRVRERRRK